MNLSIRQKALYGLAAVLFGITASGVAQEAGVTMAVQAPACSGAAGCPGPQTSVSVMDGSVIGAGPLGVVSTGGMAFALQENVEVVKNQPYQAQAVTEMKQTLADGSHITQTTTATVARDSDGRTARIQKLSTLGPWKSASDPSQSGGPTLTSIFDPVTQTHTDYTSDSKVAHILPMPTPPAGTTVRGQVSGFAMVGPGPGAGGPGPVTFAVQGHADSGEPGAHPHAKTEQLGAKTIEGLSVTGAKTTTTIPSGTIGNDKDLVITRETWYSPYLKLIIQSTQTDPRFGETTYALTNIHRNEPDPTLFQVPAGYKVEKVPVVVQSH
jgi:hypothetical protein